MGGPAEGAIFESNHMGELVDVDSKLIVNLAKATKTYHQAHAQFLNPTNEELDAFIVNWEKDFNSHHQHIHHLDALLSRDSRHRTQLGFHVISVPCYIPTTAELCATSFRNIIENIKANLAYFKEDLTNPLCFKPIRIQTRYGAQPEFL